MITYEKYLYNKLLINKYNDGLREFGDTPNCLNKCLEKLFPNNIFVHNKYLKINDAYVLNSLKQKIRPDYICEELKLIIEFDGDSGKNGHYTDPFVILKDNENYKTLTELGYKIIRIPFYVQLNKDVIKYFFDLNYDGMLYDTVNDHGFMHPLCVLPSQFCEHGIDKLVYDLHNLPTEIVKDIIKSLKFRLQYCKEQLKCFDDSIVIPSAVFRSFT